jgi:uncharacterized protein (TIGR02246 family)
LEKQQREAWNRHDAKAYASLFTEDGDCVNVVGWWWKGRAEIEKKLTSAYSYVFHESVLTITDVEVKFPAPDIAVAHVRWKMTYSAYPPEAARRYSDAAAAEARWQVANCSVPEYELVSRDAISTKWGRTRA